jgi:hypothetical protein
LYSVWYGSLQQQQKIYEHFVCRVERVEVKDVRLPQQLQRAMAAEAEAAREARAKVRDETVCRWLQRQRLPERPELR